MSFKSYCTIYNNFFKFVYNVIIETKVLYTNILCAKVIDIETKETT